MYINRLPHLLLCGLLLCQSCSYLPTADNNGAAEVTANEGTEAENRPPAAITYGNFSTETFYALLVAEVATARRQYDLALQTYLQQARETRDLGIIMHATRLAQFLRQPSDTLAMAKLWLAQHPDDIEALSLASNAHLEQAQFLAALTVAERLLAQLRRQLPDSKQRAAIVDTIANRSRNADTHTLQALRDSYLSLIAQYPEYAALGVGLSKIHAALGDKDAALTSARQAHAQDGDYLPALLQEVQLLRQDQQTDAAIDAVNTALYKHPDNQRLRLLYARLLMQTDARAAFTELQQMANAQSAQADIRFLYSLTAIEIEAWAIATTELKALLAANYRPHTVQFYLGTIAEAEGDHSRALDYYRRVQGGDEFMAAQHRAGHLLAKTQGLDAAYDYYRSLRQQFPSLQASLLGVEAEALSEAGHKEAALAQLSVALTRFPDDTQLRYNRAALYEQLDQLEAMESDLRHILHREPNNASALNALGYFLTKRTQRHQEARALIEKALAIEPDDAAIIDSMGWVLFNLGQHTEAITYLRRAFALFPDPEVAAHLGEALWVQGQQQEARSLLLNHLKAHPDNRFIVDTLNRLKIAH